MAQLESDLAQQSASKANQALASLDKNGGGTVGQILLDKILADKEAQAAEDKRKELLQARTSVRNINTTAMEKYAAFVTQYNMSYQAFMSSADESADVKLGRVKLILADPPYDASWLDASNQQAVAKMFDELVLPGGHVVLFCSWKQIGQWQNVFRKHVQSHKEWNFETVMASHRSPKFAYRSPMNGHKQMTEFVVIVHRKDPSGTTLAQQGKAVPQTKQVEEVLGDSKAGSWSYDFMIDQLPPSKEWYVWTYIIHRL